jgi:hypothetical protein
MNEITNKNEGYAVRRKTWITPCKHLLTVGFNLRLPDVAYYLSDVARSKETLYSMFGWGSIPVELSRHVQPISIARRRLSRCRTSAYPFFQIHRLKPTVNKKSIEP